MKSTLITNFTPERTPLAVAFELSKATWKIGLHDRKQEHPTIHSIADEAAQKQLGQDGFWIARELIKLSNGSMIIDPAFVTLGLAPPLYTLSTKEV